MHLGAFGLERSVRLGKLDFVRHRALDSLPFMKDNQLPSSLRFRQVSPFPSDVSIISPRSFLFNSPLYPSVHIGRSSGDPCGASFLGDLTRSLVPPHMPRNCIAAHL